MKPMQGNGPGNLPAVVKMFCAVQALTQIETLQNELDVALQEASQDRLSAAAKILRLEGQESVTRQVNAGFRLLMELPDASCS